MKIVFFFNWAEWKYHRFDSSWTNINALCCRSMFIILFFSRPLNDDAHFSSNYMINVQVFHTSIDITASHFQPHLKSLLARSNRYHIMWYISLAIVYKSIKKQLNLHENFMHSLSHCMREKFHIISTPFLYLFTPYLSILTYLSLSVAPCLSPFISLFFQFMSKNVRRTNMEQYSLTVATNGTKWQKNPGQ